MKTLLSTALVASLLAFTQPAQAAELIIDGGFENPIVTTPGLFQSGFVSYAPGASFGGPGNNSWKVVGGGNNITVTSDTEYTTGPTYYNGHTGLQWIDLTGEFDNGSAVGIEQTVATIAGATYDLSFWVGSFVDAATSINVFVNGSSIGIWTNPTGGSTPGLGTNWAQFSQAITATGTSTTLGFYYAGGRSVGGLDDVSFTSRPTSGVPEPATWALMLAGFGLVGSALRRRQGAGAHLA